MSISSLRIALLTTGVASGCYVGLEARPDRDGLEGSSSAAGDAGDASGGSDDDATGSHACDTPDLGLSPLRRLTREQYDNTVRDLLGYPESAAADFPGDERTGPFATNTLAGVSDLHVRHFSSAAETVALWAVDQPGLLPCDAAVGDATSQDACAATFIDSFASRAYRRALTDADRDRLLAVFEAGRSSGGFIDGIRLVIETTLQSPHFLYYLEFGAEEDADASRAGEVVALTGYELATRLSYFLWNTMPDEELFTAAAAGELGTDAGLEAQIARMLADSRSTQALDSFHRQWLGLETLQHESKVDPRWVSELSAAALAETLEFTRWEVREGEGTLAGLLGDSTTLTTEPALLALYGADAPPGAAIGEPFGLPADRRAGLLTRVAWLAGHAHPDQSAPVRRGKFIFSDLLCGTVPPPPPDVNNSVPPVDPDSTTRQRIEQATNQDQCKGCHAIMNPLGFALDNYDAVGAWRDHDGVAAVDADVEVVATDFSGPVHGPFDLMQRLAASEMAQRCVARQWTRFALARELETSDACTADALEGEMLHSGGNIRELIAAIARSHAFRHRRAEPAEN